MGEQSRRPERIVLGLINTKAYENLLKEIPHREFLDLAVIYYKNDENIQGEEERTIVTNSEVQKWGMKKEEMYKLAYENTFSLYPPIVVQMISEEEMSFLQFCSAVADGTFKEMNPKMLILSNENHLEGAVVLLEPGVLKIVAEYLQDDIYILPSSVHEVLGIGCRGQDLDELLEGVYEINRTLLRPGEFLSDSVYLFKRGEDILYRFSREDKQSYYEM